MGGAGSTIVDPTFGSRILRVTDSGTLANATTSAFRTPVFSWLNSWNSNSTIFWVTSSRGATVPFRFDPATMTATRISSASDPSGGLTLPFGGSFSFRRSNILYGAVGLTIVEYDFNTNAQTTVFDGRAAAPAATQYASLPSASDDDTKLCLAFGGVQGSFPYVAVLDRSSGIYHLLDTTKSIVDGHAANTTLGFGMYTAHIDRSGRYVNFDKGDLSQSFVWDVIAGTVYRVTSQAPGAHALGYANSANPSGYYGSFSDPLEWSSRNLDQANVNNAAYLIPPGWLPTPHQMIYDGRVSWNNAQPSAAAPVLASIARDSRSTLAWRLWDDEIIAVATDGSSRFWRFAHHRSLWDTASVWDQPRGNVSQDGRWFAFTSNWERTLGSDSSNGAIRQDVFIVDLSGTAPADTTAPSVAMTAPAAGATVSGTITVSASASDNAGVSGVQFLVNGAVVGAEDTSAPYAISWNTASVANGTYTLSARARDAAGNASTSFAVKVLVSNGTVVQSLTAPVLQSPTSGASGVSTSPTLTWTASGASSFDVYLGRSGSVLPLAGSTASTSYTAYSLSAGTTYAWYVVAKNSSSTATSAGSTFTTASSSSTISGTVATTSGSVLSYTVPSCGPGSTAGSGTPSGASWACGPWPGKTAPALPAPGQTTTDPYTGVRILRVTQNGSYSSLGMGYNANYRTYGSGWVRMWNANSTRFTVMGSYLVSGNSLDKQVWVGFNPSTMALDGTSGTFAGIDGVPDIEWDGANPNLAWGVYGGLVKTKDVSTGAITTIWNPSSTPGWPSGEGIWTFGVASNAAMACVGATKNGWAQDYGTVVACANPQNLSQSLTLKTENGSVNGGSAMPLYWKGSQVSWTGIGGIHAMMLSPDGKWLMVDAHNSYACYLGSGPTLYVDLVNRVAYMNNIACGNLHGGYGFNGLWAHVGVSAYWTAPGVGSACNSDIRGAATRLSNNLDASFVQLAPCPPSPNTWNPEYHMSWHNNRNDGYVNQYPIVVASAPYDGSLVGQYLTGEIYAVQPPTRNYQGRVWRFGQTWQTNTTASCSSYSWNSPNVSQDGRFLLFMSDWQGKTGGTGSYCNSGYRPDLFVWQLK